MRGYLVYLKSSHNVSYYRRFIDHLASLGLHMWHVYWFIEYFKSSYYYIFIDNLDPVFSIAAPVGSWAPPGTGWRFRRSRGSRWVTILHLTVSDLEIFQHGSKSQSLPLTHITHCLKKCRQSIIMYAATVLIGLEHKLCNLIGWNNVVLYLLWRLSV